MNSLSPRIISDLIGAPYYLNGRGPRGYDCAGLAMELQRRQGLPSGIPDTGESKLGDHLSMRRVLSARWKRLQKPQPGCIVFWPADAHVGTMVDRNRFVHTSMLVGEACIEALDQPFWIRKRHAFYVQRGSTA